MPCTLHPRHPTNTLPAQRVHDYKELDWPAIKRDPKLLPKRISICLDSCMHLMDLGIAFDLVAFDEASFTIQHLSSATIQGELGSDRRYLPVMKALRTIMSKPTTKVHVSCLCLCQTVPGNGHGL